MPLVRVGQVILFFVHIPKTGGSGIERHLQEIGQVCLVSRRATGFSKVRPQHMERETYQSYIPAGFYDQGFAMLRDPDDRMLREVRHQAKMSKPHQTIQHPLRLPGTAGRASVAGRAEGFVWRNDLDGWVEAILCTYRVDPYICDNHIRPLCEVVAEGHHLFDVEAGLDPVARWIEEVTGRSRGQPCRMKKGPSASP